MKALDRYLRDRRIRFASRFLAPDMDVLDIGCADGAMFEQLKGQFRYGYGVDPTLEAEVKRENFHLYPGALESLPSGIEVDVVTMLAVLEHLPPDVQAALAEDCYRVLRPKGRVVITVPSPRVDDVLHVLARLRLVDGMSMHEHYGFEPAHTRHIFAAPKFKPVVEQRFQLGLNNLFVFEKT